MGQLWDLAKNFSLDSVFRKIILSVVWRMDLRVSRPGSRTLSVVVPLFIFAGCRVLHVAAMLSTYRMAQPLLIRFTYQAGPSGQVGAGASKVTRVAGRQERAICAESCSV